MAKISKKTITELEDILSRGCDYADTQSVVTEYANETLKELGCELCQADDASVVDWDEDTICTVEDFANAFWDKAGLEVDSTIELEQLRTIDKKRIKDRVGKISEYDNNRVLNALKVSMCI